MKYQEYSGEYTGKRLRTGVTYAWRLFTPQDAGDGPLGLLVTHDGLNDAQAKAALTLAEAGEMLPASSSTLATLTL